MGAMTTQTDSLPRVRLLEPRGFDPLAGIWRAGVGPTEPDRHSLGVLTFNLWFGEYRWEERIAAVLRLIERHRPDVIGLQEVTPENLERILADDWVRRRYRVSDATGETVQPHGVLLLSAVPLGSLALCHLPTEKDRKLLLAELETTCGPLYVGTVHLESSPASTGMRLEQLDRVLPVLHGAEQALLMGDLNFDPADRGEQSRIEPGFTDLWQALRREDPGHTVDSERNAMRYMHKQLSKRARFDRILLRSKGAVWRPISVDLIGTEAIAPEHPEVYPSDHFGLVGVVSCNPSS